MWVGLSAKKVKNITTSIPLQNDTNSGQIIEKVEKSIPDYNYYKTNLVKCLPLNKEGKIRYPNEKEMEICMSNLLLEISIIEPKVIFLLGKKVYNFVTKYIKKQNINISVPMFYLEHPSYIWIYKKKYINDYISKVKKIIDNTIK